MKAIRAWLRAALTENVGSKLLALALSLGLYAFIHGAENAQRTFTVSIVALVPPAGGPRQLMTKVPTEVAVTLRGSRTQLDNIRGDELGTVQIDLQSAISERVEIRADMINVPAGLKIEQIYPSSIDLTWEDIVERRLPVQVSRTGEAAQGFSVRGTPIVEPAEVTVRGPRSQVETMTFARADAFDVNGLTEGTYKRPLGLDRPPEYCSFDRRSVMATLEIVQRLVTKEFSGLRVEVVGMPKAVTVPSTVTLKVEGPTEEVEGIVQESILARVEPKDLDTSQPGSAMLDVLIEVPRVKFSLMPRQVLVKWQKEKKE